MARQQKSQQLWTEAEAVERAGDLKKAMGLYVKAAIAEEDAGQPLRARLLWERIAERTGPTGTVLERLAATSGRAKLREDAFEYWRAAAARYESEGRPEDAERARVHARVLEPDVGPHEVPALARKVLGH